MYDDGPANENSLAKKNWSGGDVITECQGGWTTDQDEVISPL